MTAPYEVVGDSFRAGKPLAWSPKGLRLPNTGYGYAPHPDGKRLAVAPPDERGADVQDKLVFFSHFGDYLKKIAPVTRP